jgi:RNA recognition motif-containing protein
MKRIYVGNLAPRTDERALATLFEQYGHVSKAGIVCNQDTGERLGFGFVIMRNDRHGEKAIRALDGCNFSGNRIQVLEALPSPIESKEGHFQRAQNPLDRFRAM